MIYLLPVGALALPFETSVPDITMNSHNTHPEPDLTTSAVVRMSPLRAPAAGAYYAPGLRLAQDSTFDQPPPIDAAPSRKRKAPTLRDSDWEPMKVRIVQLYVEENLTISQLKEAINKEFKFQAT